MSSGGGSRATRSRRALDSSKAELVAVVHAETSTGVLNPVADIARIARERGALTIADAVTPLGAHPLDVAAWNVDACYSCTQKGLGAPSGLAPIAFSSRALEAGGHRAALPSTWRFSRTTGCAGNTITLFPRRLCTRSPRRCVVEEEATSRGVGRDTTVTTEAGRGPGSDGITRAHRRVNGCGHSMPSVCHPVWTRRCGAICWNRIEIGAGLRPQAGRIWRVGLMGSGSTVTFSGFLGAFESALLANSFRCRRRR